VLYFIRAISPNGFWRAGIHFTHKGINVDASLLTDAQFTAIMDEPMLIVTEIPQKVADED